VLYSLAHLLDSIRFLSIDTADCAVRRCRPNNTIAFLRCILQPHKQLALNTLVLESEILKIGIWKLFKGHLGHVSK
jgi:hypothetical protein